MEGISALIGNMGFPIAMCIILVYYINTTQKELADAINELKNTLIELKTKMEDLKNEN